MGLSDEHLEKLTVEVMASAETDQGLACVRDQARYIAMYYKTLREGMVPAALAGMLTRAWQASEWAEDSGF